MQRFLIIMFLFISTIAFFGHMADGLNLTRFGLAKTKTPYKKRILLPLLPLKDVDDFFNEMRGYKTDEQIREMRGGKADEGGKDGTIIRFLDIPDEGRVTILNRITDFYDLRLLKQSDNLQNCNPAYKKRILEAINEHKDIYARLNKEHDNAVIVNRHKDFYERNAHKDFYEQAMLVGKLN